MTKIGLLPMYVALYDQSSPQSRPAVEKFRDDIAAKLEKKGLNVIVGEVCRLEEEFEKTVGRFEAEKVDCIITLHLAYSPSLECEKALTKTKLPILVLDTTPDYSFDYTVSDSLIMFNHGIHGVQDMCNILKRGGKEYRIYAGHCDHSDVLDKISDAAKAVSAANRFTGGLKVGMVGKHFEGMGDFVVDDGVYEKLNIEIINCDENELLKFCSEVSEEELKTEYEADKKRCKMSDISFDFYKKTERVALGVRKWVRKNGLNAFSMNFQSAGEMKGFDTMPFSEACKSMAAGTAYAGEGDTLTAALLAAFMPDFPESNFVEMFCPDWKGGSIFMSHMGECNLNLMENRRMIEKDFPYADAFNPTCIMGHMAPGDVCLVNIAPDGKGSFDMTFADGKMLGLPESAGDFDNSISGWFKPDTELTEFLPKFSENGGTHHSIVVYGAGAESLKLFAERLGFRYKII